MKEYMDTEELKEAARETYRQLENELERKMEEAEEVKIQMRVVEATRSLLDEIDRLNAVNEAQQDEIDDLNQQLQDKDTQLKELGKLSAGVAKKSSADDVAKAGAKVQILFVILPSKYKKIGNNLEVGTKFSTFALE